MKRAVRSIQPSLRCRHRRLGQGSLSFGVEPSNHERNHHHDNHSHSNGIRWLSSIPYIDGLHQHQDDDRTSERRKAKKNQRGRGRKQAGQRYKSALSNDEDNAFVFSNIQEAQESMQDLLDRLVEINDSADASGPATVGVFASSDVDGAVSMDYHTTKERVRVFRDAGDVFDALVYSVDEGLLSPSGKHGRELSQLSECLLYVIGQQHPCPDGNAGNTGNGGRRPTRTSEILHADEVVHAIQEVLRVLEKDWNLDVSHRHYEQAILAACHWREWSEASDLFEKQIDPNAGGSPVRMSLENPLALYAMARRHQQRQQQRQQNQDGGDGSSDGHNDNTPGTTLPLHEEEDDNVVAEQVMDAVQRLVMVSPQDQSTYVLAAGNALGHAGYWRELDEYRRSSFLSKQYGTPLVAATLRACLLNGKYEVALDILIEEGILSPSATRGSIDEFSANTTAAARQRSDNKIEEEWQWGGARDRMDPLVRDLAMQILGGVSVLDHRDGNNNFTTVGYDSRLALDLFWESREEGVTISKEALQGVVEACERDKDWRSALSVLRTVVDEEEQLHDTEQHKIAPWIVPGDELSIAERDQIAPVNGEHATTVLTDLGPVLASVIRNCNSSSNFGLSLFALQLFRTQLLRSLSSSESGSSRNGIDPPLLPEEEIARMLSAMNLAGLTEESEEIVVASMVALSGLRCNKNSMRLYEITAGDVAAGNDADRSASSLVYQYSSLNQQRHGTLAVGNPWLSAHEHIGKLTRACNLAQNIVRGSTDAAANSNSDGVALQDHQREGIEEILARAMRSCTSAHQPELSLYLVDWMENALGAQPKLDSVAPFPQTNGKNLAQPSHGDSVTAETILALRYTQDLDGAIERFEDVLEQHTEDDLVRWRKTIAEGLSALVANGRGNDAVEIFGVLDGDARSPDGYATIGKHLSKVRDWKELIDLYRDAQAEGYHSEELGLLAMLAVTSTRVDNRLRVLRAIVDECAAGVGLDSKRWTMARYWQLKKVLGFYHARLLMWWNDESRAPLDEVNLAIKEFHHDIDRGMNPKNDVVRAIVAGASQHDALGLEQDHHGGYEKVPRSTEGWADLLEDVLATVRGSSMRCDPRFVDSVVKAYGALGKPGGCLEYVSDVLASDGTRIKRSTLSGILEIAEAERAEGVYQDVSMLLRAATPRASDGGEREEHLSAAHIA